MLYHLTSSKLPDESYLWHLYSNCITTEKILKTIGYKSKEDKSRRQGIYNLFVDKNYNALEVLLGNNLMLIDNNIIPIQSAQNFRELKSLLSLI